MSQLVRRGSALLGAVVLAIVAMVSAPGASAAARIKPDRAQITGFDFDTARPADIVEGQPNDVLIHWTAGRQLTDGTVRVTMPYSADVQQLTPVGGMGGAEAPGSFSVRPLGNFAFGSNAVIVSPPACDALPDTDPLPFDVEPNASGQQVIVISHVTCAPGQSLTVLVEKMATPAFVLLSSIEVPVAITASDATSPARDIVAQLRVVQAPRVSLHVSVPPTVVAGNTFQVTVTATLPNGKPARHYNGAVALSSSDCTMSPSDQVIAGQFTDADRGSITIDVVLDLTDIAGVHYLFVRDVAKRAAPAQSNYFDVTGFYQFPVCPVSYH